MGQGTNFGGAFGNFTVVKSNPSGNIVRFTVTDTGNLLTDDPKLIRSVLADAIEQWIVLERTDLNTNGDADVLGGSAAPFEGDGFAKFTWNFNSKFAEVTLTATTNISITGNITSNIPYGIVV